MDRIGNIREMLNELSLDAMYINHLPNVRYLCGFSGSAGTLIVTKSKNYFITDFRYKEQSAEEVKNSEIIINYQPNAELRRIFKEDNLKSVGFESTHLFFQSLQNLKELLNDTNFVPVQERIDKMNMQKTTEEVEKIKGAMAVTDKVFDFMLGFIKPGMTELEVAAELTYRHMKFGASKNSFDPIVASGIRGAFPHGIASSKKIESGEMVTLDFGCVYKGFCSDMTRTIAVGNPSDDMKKIYQIVLEAQIKSVETAKAGMSSKALDDVARNIITSAGYGDKFGHGLGHGLGIEVHELPSVSQRMDTELLENCVVTIEPGIYVEGLGGVRIEDDVLLKKDGCEVLNKSSKELIII